LRGGATPAKASDSVVSKALPAVPDRHGSLCHGALLGARVQKARTKRAPDAGEGCERPYVKRNQKRLPPGKQRRSEKAVRRQTMRFVRIKLVPYPETAGPLMPASHARCADTPAHHRSSTPCGSIAPSGRAGGQSWARGNARVNELRADRDGRKDSGCRFDARPASSCWLRRLRRWRVSFGAIEKRIKMQHRASEARPAVEDITAHRVSGRRRSGRPVGMPRLSSGRDAISRPG